MLAETLMELIRETYVTGEDLHCDEHKPCGVCRDCLIADLSDVVTPFWATRYANRCEDERETRQRILNRLANQGAGENAKS